MAEPIVILWLFQFLFYECNHWSCRRTSCEDTNQSPAHPQIQQQVTAARLQSPCSNHTCGSVSISVSPKTRGNVEAFHFYVLGSKIPWDAGEKRCELIYFF